jgi:hypothetical protein
MHRDPGRTIDSCAGSREMHTFRKLPRSSPTPNPINSNQIAAVTPEVYVSPVDVTPLLQLHTACLQL